MRTASEPACSQRERPAEGSSFEDNTTCYGQEKLSVNIAICPSLSLSPSVSHIPQKPQPLSRIKCENYVLIKRVMVILHPCICYHHEYITLCDLVLKSSSCPHGMVSNLGLNLDDHGSGR